MMHTAGELAAFLDAKLEGNPGQPVAGLSGPEDARPQDLIYCESERQLERVRASRAGTVLLPPEVGVEGKTLLRVRQAKLAFARAATLILEPEPIARGIHPTAVVAASARLGAGVAVGPHAVIEEEAEIGAGSQIGAFCYVGRGARLGEGCRLYPRVTLYAGARLGNRVALHSGVVVGSDGFGYVRDGEGRQWKFPQVGGVELGDDVEIGANTTIDRGSLGVTRIQQGVKIDNLVQVAHNVTIGEHAVVVAQTGISGSSSIGPGAVIGGQVGMGDHCAVEGGAVVGSQAGILPGKIVRRGQVVWGTPARPLAEFKKQFAWFGRLPELAARVKRLEEKASGK
jgi:UDP-3-O-[3-hydroxymyristoyl] glucosamine N-acyltransferase